MSYRRVALVGPGGLLAGQFFVEGTRTAADEGMNPSGLQEVAINVELEPWHRWDGTEWIADPELRAAAIDRSYLVEQRVDMIKVMHLIKELEARLILAGVPLDGRLAYEAQATGQELDALAHRVVELADAEPDLEVRRILGKQATKKGS